jgi:dienelactone hydrolase
VPEVEVVIPCGGVHLVGDLAIPDGARGVVIFAHGSGSSRSSPRNRLVARRLQRSRFATLLLDLLTLDEERRDAFTGELRFDVELLGDRLTSAADWLCSQLRCAPASLGCFGASTGAAAALMTAADRPELVGAVVSRGGRPDLAGVDVLRRVRAPTLLIVGGLDDVVIELNRQARRHLLGETEIEIVPGATHLFEEPGALERVAELAAAWFERNLAESVSTGGEHAVQGPG